MNTTILQSWMELDWPAIKPLSFTSCEGSVLDESAFNMIEVDNLFNTINHASTTVGQTILYRSLSHPSNKLVDIQAKQQAITELRSNTELRQAVEQLVSQAAENENKLYQLLFGKFLGSFNTAREQDEIEGYGYIQYRRAIAFMCDLVEASQALPKTESKYLQSLINTFKEFSESRDYTLMKGPVYFTDRGIKVKGEKIGLFPMPVIFKPKIFKPIIVTLLLIFCIVLSSFLIAVPISLAFFAPFLLVYFPIVGGYDRDNCIIPLRKHYKQSESAAKALDALGCLDELLSFIKFAENFGHDTVSPTLQDASHHRINLKNAKNPILGKQNPQYVGNDFALDDEKLVLITGPNSGGKTAFCKTVTQIQVLAQIGCHVPAQAATMTVADKIFYQSPEISHLNDGEGRFGTELKRTKEIFLASTAKSLVVLDELSEGTTFEERMEASANVLNGFYRKGNSTILITHNHQLVDQFVNQKTGVAQQVEFAQDAPTYKLVPGISRVSHADRVAKKIGFSKEDIDKYLEGSK